MPGGPEIPLVCTVWLPCFSFPCISFSLYLHHLRSSGKSPAACHWRWVMREDNSSLIIFIIVEVWHHSVVNFYFACLNSKIRGKTFIDDMKTTASVFIISNIQTQSDDAAVVVWIRKYRQLMKAFLIHTSRTKEMVSWSLFISLHLCCFHLCSWGWWANQVETIQFVVCFQEFVCSVGGGDLYLLWIEQAVHQRTSVDQLVFLCSMLSSENTCHF